MQLTIIDPFERAAYEQWQFQELLYLNLMLAVANGTHQQHLHAHVEPADNEQLYVNSADTYSTEHVLKGSKSFTVRSLKGRQSNISSLRVPSTTSNNENSSISSNDAFLPPAPSAIQPQQALNEIVPNGQVLFRPGRSPTPSLKRAAVEALKQNHGSPNHVRVTAGGRIVDAAQSPLCQPRYGYSAIQVNGSLIKFAPNQRFGQRQGETEPAVHQQGQIVEDEFGNRYQIVGNKILPLHVRADGFMETYIAASNVSAPSAHMPPAHASGPAIGPIVNNPAIVPEPSIEVQLKALKDRYVIPSFFDAPSILLTSFADIRVTPTSRSKSTNEKHCTAAPCTSATKAASSHDVATLSMSRTRSVDISKPSRVAHCKTRQHHHEQ